MTSALKHGLVACAVALMLLVVLSALPWSRVDASPPQATPSSLGRAPLVPPGPSKSPVVVIGAIAVPPFLSSIDIM
jgi:hypothetical protein